MRNPGLLIMLGAAIALSGCASSSTPEARPETAAARPVAAPRTTAPAIPSSQLVGRTAQSLVGLFGQPALDVREGSARKLQFSGPDCVLDTYLYPRQGSGEAVVTHVDARSPDGRDADRAACVEALRRR